mgnify:FL=1
MERILTELRNYTEHSQAFLVRVSKRDAPDYYDGTCDRLTPVIQNPMDLGTMQKKLRGGCYKTKSQFAHDLNLIWDNCLVYNASPTHPLRRNATFMRKKANHLLEFLSDKNDTQDLLSQWQSASHAEKPIEEIPQAADAPATETPTTPSTSAPAHDVPFSQRHALRRNPESCLVFHELDAKLSDLEDGANAANPAPTLDVLHQVPASHLHPLAAALPQSTPTAQQRWWAACASDAMLCAGLPVVPHAGHVWDHEPDAVYTSRLPIQRAGIPRMMAQNIQTLRRLYSTHQKIHELAEAIESDVPIPPSIGVLDDEDEPEPPSVPPPVPYVTSTPYPRLSRSYAQAQTSWQVQVLLAHAGFEGAHSSPVQVLADVAAKYLMGLGRTLRLYVDRFAHHMSPTDMLEHVMLSRGTNLSALESYVSQDIGRYGQRLQEWLRKQKHVFHEQLQGVDSATVDDADLLASDSEALMLGHFAAGLGDDFFGFRELGLESELGLPHLAVPSRLFFGTSHAPHKVASDGKPGMSKPVLDAPPPPVPLVACSLPAQIGLLRTWYAQQLGSMPFLPDQVPERPRYKVPTTGKLPARPMVSRAHRPASVPAGSAPQPQQQAKRQRVS